VLAGISAAKRSTSVPARVAAAQARDSGKNQRAMLGKARESNHGRKTRSAAMPVRKRDRRGAGSRVTLS